MRVDASQVLGQGGIKTKQGTDALAGSGKDGGLSGTAAAEGAEEDFSVAQPNLMRGFSDKSLAPYAAKLAELNMTVTEDSARTMRELMAQYPRLSMDEAAFLASNKITGDESMMNAALEVLSGGDKTSEMISQIISTLGERDSLVTSGLATRGAGGFAGSDGTMWASSPTGGAVVGSPLSELIAAIVKHAPELLQASNDGDSGYAKDTQQIISQPDGNLQSNVENIEENYQKNINTVGDAPLRDPQSATGSGVSEPDSNRPPASDATVGRGIPDAPTAEQTPNSDASVGRGIPASASQTLRAASEQTPTPNHPPVGDAPLRVPHDPDALPGTPPTEQTGQPAQGKTMANTVAELLSEMPEFKGTPQTALDRFSNMLLRVAKDSGIPADGEASSKDIEKLAAQLEKMFTKIDREDSGAGARLRQAREELFARLTLAQEEISRAAQPMRENLLSQTQKLMNHVRLLNNIDQFVYMQLPVNIREEHKTAELYVFKRKGGKKADPDNVNILLSIDLEFMGHWEALLNIKGKDVYLNMEVAGEAEKEHFSENTVMLHELLSEEGFKLVSTNIKISQKETTPLTALSAFDRYTGGIGAKIDFKI